MCFSMTFHLLAPSLDSFPKLCGDECSPRLGQLGWWLLIGCRWIWVCSSSQLPTTLPCRSLFVPGLYPKSPDFDVGALLPPLSFSVESVASV
jgi:hypothetical protein